MILVCALEEQIFLEEQSKKERKLMGKRLVLRLEQQLMGCVLRAKPLFVF